MEGVPLSYYKLVDLSYGCKVVPLNPTVLGIGKDISQSLLLLCHSACIGNFGLVASIFAN